MKGRIAIVVLAAVLIAISLIWPKGFVLTFLSQVAILAIFAMSYNVLLGQTGLLSFGHAVYAGLGAFCAIHVLNVFGADALGLGVLALPLAGGLGGALAGIVFGFVSTRRSGTTFAMITLGIAEMISASALMIPDLFGGEAGVTTNRMLSRTVLGIDFGSDRQIYLITMAWAAVALAAMYFLTRTPLARIANAVRDNADRAAFISFDPQTVRFLMMVVAGFFAGIAGGISVLNYELVTVENLGPVQSGMVLIAVYLGGIGYFLGPVVGALIYVLFLTLLSTITKAWLLYFGLLFIGVVVFVPAGLASLVVDTAWTKRLTAARIALMALGMTVGIATIEAIYARQGTLPQADATVVSSVFQLRGGILLWSLLTVSAGIATWRIRRPK